MTSSLRQRQMLKTMGIPVWSARRDIAGQKPVDAFEHLPAEKKPQTLLTDDWPMLQQKVADCTACELHLSRSNPVFGTGNRQAELLMIGDAPEKQEDLKGEPFLGPAGHLLNEMLFALGFCRDQVYMTNAIKCFSAEGRRPSSLEIESCVQFVFQQIRLVRPKLILCLGAVSSQCLLGSKEPIGRLRGRLYVQQDTGLPLVATYHPAYLLRNPLKKNVVWRDLLLVKKQLGDS